MGRNCLPVALSKIDFSLFVILNLFQDNEPRSHVILKRVQDDERVALRNSGDRCVQQKTGHASPPTSFYPPFPKKEGGLLTIKEMTLL